MELKDLKFGIMNSLFAVGDSYIAELEEARASEKRKQEARKTRAGQQKAKKQLKGEGLRVTDPWPTRV